MTRRWSLVWLLKAVAVTATEGQSRFASSQSKLDFVFCRWGSSLISVFIESPVDIAVTVRQLLSTPYFIFNKVTTSHLLCLFESIFIWFRVAKRVVWPIWVTWTQSRRTAPTVRPWPFQYFILFCLSMTAIPLIIFFAALNYTAGLDRSFTTLLVYFTTPSYLSAVIDIHNIRFGRESMQIANTFLKLAEFSSKGNIHYVFYIYIYIYIYIHIHIHVPYYNMHCIYVYIYICVYFL